MLGSGPKTPIVHTEIKFKDLLILMLDVTETLFADSLKPEIFQFSSVQFKWFVSLELSNAYTFI